MNLKEILQQYQKELRANYDLEEANALFFAIVKHLLGYGKADFILQQLNEITSEVSDNLLTVLQELKKGKPLQYILGETEFYGLPIKVNPSVLIPRPETEELVDWIISVYKTKLESYKVDSDQTLNILDIGTGSGCIAIALKKYLPNAKVCAIDIAADSLETALKNAFLNNVEVHFSKQDILAHDINFEFKLDVIVSNPPYVTENEKETIHENVLAYEPHRALFVSNEKPLLFYEAIADFALKNLRLGGALYLEINEYLGKETIEMLSDKGFEKIELKQDMQGKDRMISCIIT